MTVMPSEYPYAFHAPEEPEIRREGRTLVMNEYARTPIRWTLTFPDEEWAATVEARLHRNFEYLRTYVEPESLEGQYADAVRYVSDFIRYYVPKGLVKYSVAGVNEAFMVADA